MTTAKLRRLPRSTTKAKIFTAGCSFAARCFYTVILYEKLLKIPAFAAAFRLERHYLKPNRQFGARNRVYAHRNRRACSGGDIAAWRAQIHGAQKTPFLLQHNSLRRRDGLSWIMLFPAYSHIGVSLSSQLYYCGPVIVMLLSPALFCEKLTLQRVCARARGDTLRQRRCRQRQP